MKGLSGRATKPEFTPAKVNQKQQPALNVKQSLSLRETILSFVHTGSQAPELFKRLQFDVSTQILWSLQNP